MGQIVNGNYEGKGILVRDNLYMEGIFKNGKFVEGWTINENGKVKEGEFESDGFSLKSGIMKSSKFTCKGTFENDIPNGSAIHYIWYFEKDEDPSSTGSPKKRW